MLDHRKFALRGLSVAAVFSATAIVQGQSIWYVDSSVSSSGNGQSWATAKKTFQEGVAAASAGHEVRVADGTYKPTNAFASLELKHQVNIKGGYIGDNGTIDPNTRNPMLYQSILSGNLGGGSTASTIVVVPDGTEPPNFTSQTPYEDRANLDGFYITGANGGTALYGGTPNDPDTEVLIRDCVFHDNSGYAGAAFNSFGCNATFRKCEFYNNSATSGDGGAVISSGRMVIMDCNFHGNDSAADGGAIKSFGELWVISTMIEDNDANNAGGGISVKDADGPIKIINSVVVVNTANGRGGGIEIASAGSTPLEIINCTIADNTAGADGGGIYYSSSSTSYVKNSILWGNSAVGSGSQAKDNSSSLNVSYTDISGGWSGSGTNNKNEDPLFVGGGDYHLTCGPNSPCLNAGLNSNVPADSHDVNENPADDTGPTPDRDIALRIETTVDMGAYETQYTGCKGEANGIFATHGVDVDDLLTVINNWGTCSTPCPGDLEPHPCGNGIVDTDDLLEVINNWGNQCNGFTGSGGGSFDSVEDCMDAASLEFDPFSPEWDEFVEKCVNALCAAEILDCED